MCDHWWRSWRQRREMKWEKMKVRKKKSERWSLSEREKETTTYTKTRVRVIIQLLKCSVITWWVDDDHYNHWIIINSKILLGLRRYSCWWNNTILNHMSSPRVWLYFIFWWLYYAKCLSPSDGPLMIHHNTLEVKCWKQDSMATQKKCSTFLW